MMAYFLVQGSCQQVTLRVLCSLGTHMAGRPGPRNSLLLVQPSKMPSGLHQAMLLLQSLSGRSNSSSSLSQPGVGMVESSFLAFLPKRPHPLAVSTCLMFTWNLQLRGMNIVGSTEARERGHNEAHMDVTNSVSNKATGRDESWSVCEALQNYNTPKCKHSCINRCLCSTP